MQNFMWHNPTAVIFGKDTVKELAPRLKSDGIKGVLLVFGGKGTFKSGAYAQATEMLNSAGITFSEVNDVKANPLIDKVRDGIARVKAGGIDAIMPVGGGSVFDTAKAIAAGACYSDDVWDFFTGKAKITKALPIYGILTASASSSEVNNIAVVSNPDSELKTSITSPALYPRVSVIDPSFQFTLPTKQTVYGGVDIIAHILERVLDGDEGSELIDEQGYALIRTMMRVIPELIDNPKDYDLRAEYAMAGMMAHCGFLSMGRAARGDFSSHRMGHSLSMLYGAAHGATLAVVMPAWARYLYEENPVPFARMGEGVFDIFDGSDEEKALEAIEALEDFFRDINAPTTLRELGIKEEDIEKIAENASRGESFGVLSTLEPEDVLEIYKLAY
ncbi:MAG: iron-containing alcohol dehydrogenase [Synergistaceae bacterium]|nr:iron-containing alcohol dehydrogenase [Synergistaceae bacterium]MBQ3399173.1 iron-containing alcohol dehydrogenase [Synergistaceae bacterium]MBQ4402700.1 iron-containing alcohol dehydrogenase [Synergistaceae bacterium]MBQ6115452.1 iron-containing alcohol dehydrogenase [Synergistaceae bacterium]MBQ6665801.1 iron-containing alcohol dehydrogenase [Synergistaceae bacterium]